ncbi:MAG: mannose-1-phosphate guanylyltransferase [Candidatus Dormibacteraeota bacterium]|uniref:Mannose-1-phosphate guanylyltransferase n=1 Tax=Candidatus Amunia macphersoniae TaxID=3127014 RepID=A0A934NG70_9BACT|nr:mannose-1-phosphate guanylyltransferase [Candidatus Dormibacteraeota bacterium]
MAFHIVVLAGGSGTRLWPLSRAAVPKHLLPLGPGDATLLRATVERVVPLGGSIHLVTATGQAAACLDALDGGGSSAVTVIAEPIARGTGPALGLAVHQIARTDPDAVIASVHADHWVGDEEAYRAAVLASAGWAVATDGLATVGLTPSAPATGLGYIALGEDQPPERWTQPSATGADPVLVAAAAALHAARAQGFVEKPDRERAEEFIRDGRHLWNLGLFAWTAGAFLAELAAADPGLDLVLRRVVEARASGDESLATRLYTGLVPLAVEPLLFERTSRLTVVRAHFEWSDLGTWADLAASRHSAADVDGNVSSGGAVLVGTRGCYVESRGGRMVAVVGAEGLAVIDTGDAVLVLPLEDAQRVRMVVDQLRDEGRDDLM